MTARRREVPGGGGDEGRWEVCAIGVRVQSNGRFGMRVFDMMARVQKRYSVEGIVLTINTISGDTHTPQDVNIDESWG